MASKHKIAILYCNWRELMMMAAEIYGSRNSLSGSRLHQHSVVENIYRRAVGEGRYLGSGQCWQSFAAAHSTLCTEQFL